jgi:CDP-diacylglycerol--glycerol-3-phosphate 3-phosphatidyltransferase
VEEIAKKKPKTLSDSMRVIFKGILDPIAGFLNNLGLKPNTVTILGLIGHFIGAYFLMKGEFLWGGLIILLMAPIDVLDGAMARLRGEPKKFGSFVDSVVDRYEELLIFGGLLIFYVHQQNWLACLLVYLSAAGSILVSYIRSKAETLGFEAKVGILTRFERYVVLIPSLVFNLVIPGLWILAILSNFTAIQRIFHVRKQAHDQKEILE